MAIGGVVNKESNPKTIMIWPD